ncbi:uncharacterized protein C8A04DRAFT_25156 [Dichotomopilus funicola]|uniref:Uncharacterized protein n=1 Tax=Dichotomopilus funicola TaxID=1934379 RepID=A0AAN6ZQC1_9PEZI|nr:hypothetical protein C8A04DRAFT_25156 [Dichotomopilus funicola]
MHQQVTSSAKANLEYRRYHAELNNWQWVMNPKPEDSIVRDVYTPDGRHHVIKQEMAISIFEIGKTWMAIACTDAGGDLTKGTMLPWLEEVGPVAPTIVPIIQYRPKCALNSRVIPKTKGNAQSLAVFPERDGHRLDWASAKSDRFPILSEVFRLSAFSRKQLLNLLQTKIIAETNRLQQTYGLPELLSVLGKPTFANLLYYRNILQDQVTDLSQMLLLTNGESRIFHNSASRPVTAHNAMDMYEVHSLLQDLHLQAQSLVEKCSQGMTVISNNSMLEESQRAIQ